MKARLLTVIVLMLLPSISSADVTRIGACCKPDGFCMLATAERTFDADGRLRLGSDERMSTLITPTGLPIEGGWQGAITNRFGYGFRTPVDQLQTRRLEQTTARNGAREVAFDVTENGSGTGQKTPAGDGGTRHDGQIQFDPATVGFGFHWVLTMNPVGASVRVSLTEMPQAFIAQ